MLHVATPSGVLSQSMAAYNSWRGQQGFTAHPSQLNQPSGSSGQDQQVPAVSPMFPNSRLTPPPFVSENPLQQQHAYQHQDPHQHQYYQTQSQAQTQYQSQNQSQNRNRPWELPNAPTFVAAGQPLSQPTQAQLQLQQQQQQYQHPSDIYMNQDVFGGAGEQLQQQQQQQQYIPPNPASSSYGGNNYQMPYPSNTPATTTNISMAVLPSASTVYVEANANLEKKLPPYLAKSGSSELESYSHWPPIKHETNALPHMAVPMTPTRAYMAPSASADDGVGLPSIYHHQQYQQQPYALMQSTSADLSTSAGSFRHPSTVLHQPSPSTQAQRPPLSRLALSNGLPRISEFLGASSPSITPSSSSTLNAARAAQRPLVGTATLLSGYPASSLYIPSPQQVVIPSSTVSPGVPGSQLQLRPQSKTQNAQGAHHGHGHSYGQGHGSSSSNTLYDDEEEDEDEDEREEVSASGALHISNLHGAHHPVTYVQTAGQAGPSTPLVASNPGAIGANATPRFECDLCGKTFKYKGGVQKHKLHIHMSQRKHKCTECELRFSDRSNLKTHLLTVHQGKRLYQCDICFKRYGQKGQLNAHKRCVHEKKRPFGCVECPKVFSTRSNLRVHYAALHNKEYSTTDVPVRRNDT